MSYNLSTLIKVFNKIANTGNAVSEFSNILDFFMAGFRYEETEEKLRQVFNALRLNPKKDLYAEFLEELGNLMSDDGFSDPLGEFYMQHITYGRPGQYFIPEPIASMMAAKAIAESPNPGQSIVDPACRSGRTLLAAAKIERNLRFYGTDVDGICCKMCVVNMLLNSMCGEVAHMNTLTGKFFRGYHLRTKIIDGYHHSFFFEFTEPQKSAFWVRQDPPGDPTPPPPSGPEEGNLF